MNSALHNFYSGKRVLVTGHTGFKGSWLCEWLLSLGAEVAGYALDPQPHETLYSQLGLGRRIAQDSRGNLSERSALAKVVADFYPQIILHLAAQPLVRYSYDIPVETFAANVMGTAHLLDAVRIAGNPVTIVAVTTDKCYENREWLHAYREEDAMGGHDPYSASKGAAEIIISSYRRSFFPPSGPIKLASARAGNVIGGGDWAQDRIVPDSFRALLKGQAIPVRNKIATRPWQHVLEPISGYLWLAACLDTGFRPFSELSSAFNFGPNLVSNKTVAVLVSEIIKHSGGTWTDATDQNALHEASKLNLSTDKAFHLLEWKPVWSFEETVAYTTNWYVKEAQGSNPLELTQSHIRAYEADAAHNSLRWAI